MGHTSNPSNRVSEHFIDNLIKTAWIGTQFPFTFPFYLKLCPNKLQEHWCWIFQNYLLLQSIRNLEEGQCLLHVGGSCFCSTHRLGLSGWSVYTQFQSCCPHSSKCGMCFNFYSRTLNIVFRPYWYHLQSDITL